MSAAGRVLEAAATHLLQCAISDVFERRRATREADKQREQETKVESPAPYRVRGPIELAAPK